MRRSGPFDRALVAALALHAALLALALRARHEAARAPGAGRAEDASLELDLTPSDPPPAAEEAPPPTLPSGGEAPRALIASRAPAKSAPGQEGGESLAPPAVPFPNREAAPGAPETSAEGWAFSPLAADRTIGLAPGHAPLGPGLGAAHPEAEVTEGGALASVRDALDARDHEIGLGAGGPLVNLARDSVREGLAPNVGHALFELSTDRMGIVVSVRVLDASSDRNAWDDVAKDLAKKARAHPLRVPPGANGVAVTLRLDSVVRTKSGHDAGETAISLFGVPVKKSRAAQPVQIDLSIPIISGNIDPTDIVMDATSKPERIVFARVVEERRL